MAIGIDNDCSTGRIYWSDISEKKIFSSKYDGTDKSVFISEGLSIKYIFDSVRFGISLKSLL